MRWNKKVKVEPNFLDKRIIEKFLLFPVRINEEYRWLEKAKIEQVYTHSSGRFGMRFENKKWVD